MQFSVSFQSAKLIRILHAAQIHPPFWLFLAPNLTTIQRRTDTTMSAEKRIRIQWKEENPLKGAGEGGEEGVLDPGWRSCFSASSFALLRIWG